MVIELAATSLARVLKLTGALAISSSVLADELGWARFHLVINLLAQDAFYLFQ